jgi:DNA-binding transcriptional regulator/RsmH inhibitor MraZ
MPSSTFNSLFEELLEKKSVEVMVLFTESESLRVSLTRRWNQYKDKMDSLGFLSENLRSLSLSREKLVVTSGEVTVDYTRFVLKPREVRRTYQILSPAVPTDSVAVPPNNTEDGK